MKIVDVSDVKKRKPTPDEQDKFEFYSNRKTTVPEVYQHFGKSGLVVLGLILLIAAWSSVFIQELQEVLYVPLVMAWRVGVVYTVISLLVYAGICLWYRNKHIPYVVFNVYCTDAVQSDYDDEIVYVFQTMNNEQFTMLRSQFSYIPASFSVQLYYLIAYDQVNEQYLIYQVDEE